VINYGTAIARTLIVKAEAKDVKALKSKTLSEKSEFKSGAYNTR
jgi:hypothetical protein